MHKRSIGVLIIGFLIVAGAPASDLAKERRWADQIVDSLLDGEAVYLNDGRADFLALETTAAEPGAGKAAIVLHGTGVHPNWPTVVQPLRVGLTDFGWHTLSLQMPVLANEATHAEYAEIYGWIPGRLDAAAEHLRAQGFSTLVLIGHSQGATMALHYLSGGQRPVAGFIAVGLSAGIEAGPMDNLSHLAVTTEPMLDLYGGVDSPEVIESAAARASRATLAKRDYQQVRVPGADHFFEGEEAALLDQVTAWLNDRF